MEIVKKFYQYLTMPALIAGHWYTQHAAFLYLIGVLSVVHLIVMLLGLACIFILAGRDDFTTVLPTITTWKIVVSYVYLLAMIAYLLYVQAFVIATIFIISSILLYTLFVMMNEYIKRQTMVQELAKLMGQQTTD